MADPIATKPAEDPNAPIVVFSDVSIHFDAKPVLKNSSFEVDHGQTLIILGPAGCGKSVLMKLANGLLRPRLGHHRHLRRAHHLHEGTGDVSPARAHRHGVSGIGVVRLALGRR